LWFTGQVSIPKMNPRVLWRAFWTELTHGQSPPCLTLQAMETEMEAAMEGMQWPGSDGTAPTGDENSECKQS
jgi:hypothetical protein